VHDIDVDFHFRNLIGLNLRDEGLVRDVALLAAAPLYDELRQEYGEDYRDDATSQKATEQRRSLRPTTRHPAIHFIELRKAQCVSCAPDTN
jgi:hypothetical protein